MEIITAENAGFCYGVKRAITLALKEIECNTKVVTYGPLIHNQEVINELYSKGIRVVDNLNDVRDETVIIRSHGVPPSIYKELEKRNINYIDGTCFDVKKIHKIVETNYINNYKIIIIGDDFHPEVIGINGYANNEGIIINDYSRIDNYVLSNILNNINKYCIVVQTTFELEKFNTITQKLNSLNLNIKINNTICMATKNRQEETERISKIVDKMLIFGDKNSNNTRKLYEISKKFCSKSYLINSVSEIQLNNFNYGDKIGISAGASTPPGILKEAIYTMSEQINNNEQSFEELLEQSFVTLHNGDIVKGTVLRVSDGEVYVNLGYKSDGIISRDEFSDDHNFKAEDHFKQDDEIEVFVVKINDGEGNVSLSRKRIEARRGNEEIANAFNNKTTIKGKIVEVVKGGLITSIKGVRVFVPSSQISNKYVEDLKSFIGNEFDFNIIEFDPKNRRVVAGRKDIAKQEDQDIKNKVFDTLEIGARLKGTVRRIVDFGAFIDLGGMDGLIHISELSWGRVKKVTEVLKEGDIVDVVVIDFNKDKGKISLSLKDVKSDPWLLIEEKYPIGLVVSGKVARMTAFGAFIELEDGIDGLVHVSQISTKHVAKPEDALTLGEVIEVKVIDVSSENKRISLSKKEVDEPTESVDNANSEDGTKDSTNVES